MLLRDARPTPHGESWRQIIKFFVRQKAHQKFMHPCIFFFSLSHPTFNGHTPPPPSPTQFPKSPLDNNCYSIPKMEFFSSTEYIREHIYTSYSVWTCWRCDAGPFKRARPPHNSSMGGNVKYKLCKYTHSLWCLPYNPNVYLHYVSTRLDTVCNICHGILYIKQAVKIK